MKRGDTAAWKRMMSGMEANQRLDITNTKPCKEGEHSCAFMQSALDSKGSLDRAISFTGKLGRVAFVRKPRNLSILILSYCPWCGEKI